MAYIKIAVALLMKFSCLLSHTFILLVVVVQSVESDSLQPHQVAKILELQLQH